MIQTDILRCSIRRPGLGLAVCAGLVLVGLASVPSPAAESEDATPLRIVVMDPLAGPLACDCVEGYAQRKYDLLATYLDQWLPCKVEVVFSQSLGRGVAAAGGGPVDLVIGKHSVVAHDAAECRLALRPVARLTGKDGLTTLTGLFVVPAADRAKTLADLKGYRLLFGPPEEAEKHAAAVAALEKAGVPVPDDKETFPSCAEAAVAALESEAKPGTVAVISSYAVALLEGCGTIDKGSLRVIGRTEPLPFVTVFATEHVGDERAEQIVEALVAMRQIPPLLTAMETKTGFVKLPKKEGGPETDTSGEGPSQHAPSTPGEAGPADATDDAGTGQWRQWRGPGRDGTVPWLPDKLPAEPNVVWRTELTGPGLSGVAATDKLLVVADRDPSDRLDIFRCLQTSSGDEVWTYQYPAQGDLDYGNSPRATPLVYGGRVYLLGAFGDLNCLRLDDGRIEWQKSFVRDFGAKVPKWGWSGSPLVVDGKLIVNPGAPGASLVALDPATGDVVWLTPGGPAAYASLVVGTLGGVRQIVGYDAVSLGGWDPASGRRLWTLVPPEPDDFNVPTPLVTGGKLLAATENNGTRLYGFDGRGVIQPSPLAEHSGLAPETTSPVAAGDRLLGCWDGLFCLDLSAGLAERWIGADPAYEDHVSLLTDGRRLLALSARGELLLVDLSGDAYQPLGKVPLLGDDAEVLSHPALVGHRLYVRAARSVMCVDLD